MKRKLTALVVMMCMLIGCVPLGTLAENDAQTWYYGDVNMDGTVNTADATLILKYSSSMIMIEPDTLQYELADANRDGFVNTADASFILRYAAGMGNIYPYLTAVTVTYSAGDCPQDAEVYVPRAVEAKPGSVHTVANGAVYAGHTFLCWQSDYDNQVYQPGQTFIVPDKNVTLTAIWQTGGDLQPTSEPTAQPTQTPIEGGAKISVHYYDSFNEQDVGTFEQYVPGDIHTLTVNYLDIPTGYMPENSSLAENISISNGTASPASFNINVYPYEMTDGREYKVIYTVRGFMKMQNGLSLNYVLGNDIELTSQIQPFGWNWQDSTQPDTYFTGIFDGKGHAVRGLWIDETVEIISNDGQNIEYRANTNVGLFAVNTGTIRNLTVYTRPWDGIMGHEDYGVYGDINVGIICGANGGTVQNCHAYGNVGTLDPFTPDTGDLPNAGGLVGKNAQGAVIERSSYEGGVEGFELCGGISGTNYGTIRECYFAGGINWGDDMTDELLEEYEITSIGGICGAGIMSSVSDCYVFITEQIKSYGGAGGISGMDAGSTYRNCFVQNTQNIYQLVDTGTGDTYVGHKHQSYNTTESGLYSNVSSMPTGYSTAVWDMNGAGYPTVPDLINNRRGQSFYKVQG